MNSILPRPRLEVPPERPLDRATIALLKDVQAACEHLGAEFVLAGATARDVQMWHIHGIRAPVATRDVDVAVCAVSWEFHDELIALLVETGRFRRAAKEQQKLLFKRAEDRALSQLDLVPFGPIEVPSGQIAWPPNGDIVMSVLGFREAVDTADDVNLGEGLTVPVVAIPAFILLKLVAWRDRRQYKNSDASDLLFIFRQYFDAGNAERVYNEAQNLLDAYDFNVRLAAVGLLGRQARDVAGSETFDAIRTVLTSPIEYEKLRNDLQARAGAFMLGEFVDDSDELLAAFAKEFIGPAGKSVKP